MVDLKAFPPLANFMFRKKNYHLDTAYNFEKSYNSKGYSDY